MFLFLLERYLVYYDTKKKRSPILHGVQTEQERSINCLLYALAMAILLFIICMACICINNLASMISFWFITTNLIGKGLIFPLLPESHEIFIKILVLFLDLYRLWKFKIYMHDACLGQSTKSRTKTF